MLNLANLRTFSDNRDMAEKMLDGPVRATRSHMFFEGTVTDWANAHENSRTASAGVGRPIKYNSV